MYLREDKIIYKETTVSKRCEYLCANSAPEFIGVIWNVRTGGGTGKVKALISEGATG